MLYALQGDDLGIKQSDSHGHFARFCFMPESPLGLQFMGGDGQIFAGMLQLRYVAEALLQGIFSVF